MSVTRDHLAEHVLDALIDVSGWAEQNGWPREAVLASALETVVNLLAFERGADGMAATLEQLADTLRRGEVVVHGWVLARLQQPA
jgi:hypothetical protein